MVVFQHHHQCLCLQHRHQHDGDHGNLGHHAQQHVEVVRENVTDNANELILRLNVMGHIDKLVFVILIHVQPITFGYHGQLGAIVLGHVVLDNRLDEEDVLALRAVAIQFKFNNARTPIAMNVDQTGTLGHHGQIAPRHVQVGINIDFVLAQHDNLMLVRERAENFNPAI